MTTIHHIGLDDDDSGNDNLTKAQLTNNAILALCAVGEKCQDLITPGAELSDYFSAIRIVSEHLQDTLANLELPTHKASNSTQAA